MSAEESGNTGKIVRWIVQHNGALAILVFAIIFGSAVLYGIFKEGFVDNLSDIAYARGLITFLVAMCSISVIMLVVCSTYWMSQQDLEQRYGRAKDLMTLVIGILGTILGFYYGSSESGSAATNKIEISDLSVSSPVATNDRPIRLTAKVSNGDGPYSWEVRFFDVNNQADVSKLDIVAVGGAELSKAVSPAGIKVPALLQMLVVVTDSNGEVAEAPLRTIYLR
jgi:hypothetical protein